MTTNPRFVTRPPKAGKRREREYTPVAGKPLPPSAERRFKAIFGAPKK